jgi:hypothetical protein
MRAPLFQSLLVLCGTIIPAAAEEPYPYLVHVATDGAPLRSGPGEEYYETSRLPAGTAVEVWRAVPDGWLAVRPPRGSFSLVSAADVRVRPDRVAEAVRGQVPVRVGSHPAAARDVVQVELEDGERVQVLETVSLDGEFWHKIAPPSGEFRWIHEAQVAGPGGSRTTSTAATHDGTESGLPEPVAESPATDGPGYRIARHSAAAVPAGPKSNAPAGRVAPRTLADATSSGTGQDADAAIITSAEIELELATIVAEDSRLWQFANLKRLCEDLLTSSIPTERRQDLEALLEKIARFERIRDRKLAILGVPPASAGTEANSLATRNEVADAAPVSWRAIRAEDGQPPGDPISAVGDVVRIPDQSVESAEEPGRYDGIGTLRPVVSRRREAPRFALVDPEGDVVTFITPSPGVNLQPYVGQRIGVVGTRGYMPEFKRTHVTAARVTPLR